MYLPFRSAVQPPEEQSEPAWWFVFQGDRLLVSAEESSAHIPYLRELTEIDILPSQQHYLGQLGDSHCHAVDLHPDVPLPAGMSLAGLRGLHGRLEERLYALAGRASQILVWDRTHQFCGQCGTPTAPLAGERARQCPACGLTCYPRLSPVVIVRITRGDEILLARGIHFADGMYSTPAGFVEPGETLEEAVRRELHEEVGIEVRNIRYFGSQPWPYPHQLMVGFTAEWASGEIRIDPHELADAQWFTRERMPHVPPKGVSISRALIDSYVER